MKNTTPHARALPPGVREAMVRQLGAALAAAWQREHASEHTRKDTTPATHHEPGAGTSARQERAHDD